MAERKPKSTRYAPGVEGFGQIIRAAETVLVEKGHAALTLRRISDECGLKVGNLSYYFPTKQDLVKALLERLMVTYQDDLGQIEIHDKTDAEALLTSVVFYWMRENQTRHASRLWIELWSMANNDPYIREEVDRSYGRGFARFQRILSGINPELSGDDLDAMSLFAISLVEGLMVFANKDQPGGRLMPQLASYAVTTLLDLARNPDPALQRSLAARWRGDELMTRAK